MTCHGQWAEGAEVATVVKCDQAERNDDQQNRFLVDVPAEEERGVSAESGSCHEVGPCRAQEKLNECRLKSVVSIGCVHQSRLGKTYYLSGESQDKCYAWCNVRQDGESSVAD